MAWIGIFLHVNEAGYGRVLILSEKFSESWASPRLVFEPRPRHRDGPPRI